MLAGLAAIVGPVIGGQLAKLADWRGAFGFLAVVGGAILVASAGVVRETLLPARRHSGGLAESGRVFRRLLTDRVFLGAVLLTGFVNAALFAYLSGATFVLQGIYGLSPQGYSLAFGLNSLGFVTFGFLAGRISARWSVRGTLAVGLGMVVAGASGVLVTAVAHLPLAAIVLSLLTMVSGVAVTTPPATSLALENYPDVAGSASSLLGLARFALGGLTAPLVGLAGAGTAVPLGIVAVAAALLSFVGYALLHRSVPAARQQEPGRRSACPVSA
ncbi:MFS transporter [Actinopolymorpha singaporensis]